jgi:ATP-binding cassette subfamily B protein
MHGNWHSFLRADADKPRPKITRAILARVLAYARPHTRAILIVLATIVTSSLLELLPPLLYRELIDTVLPNRDFGLLNWLAVGMLGVPLLVGLLDLVERHYSARAGEGIIYDLRGQMYAHLQRMGIRFFTHTKSGEIISRFNSDVVGAQNAITGTLPNILTNIVTLVSTVVIMVSIEWRLAIMSVLVVPLFMFPARRVGRILRDIRRKAMEHNAEMSNIVSETLSINGALLVKTFATQPREAARFDHANAEVRAIGIRRARVTQLYFLGLGLIGTIGTALIYWVGGYMVLTDAISTGTIVAFAAYLMRLYGPISGLANVQVEFAQSLVSFERVFEYLDQPVEIQDPPNAVVLNNVAGAVRFDRVWFQYQPTAEDAPSDAATGSNTGSDTAAPISSVPTRRWALEDASFSVEPGQLVALVGPSGAGKTTITYLLPRLYDPNRGSITLDGIDLRATDQQSLARQIGMVTQESYLFHDTIRANLVYAKPDATQAELEAACRAANIHDMIMALPQRYETLVGERGYRLSGGEKQRLAIARVILKNPRILVLDEATSHLDSQNEALIQAALEPLFAGRTSIVIAHRLSTILAADKILVLDQGHIVEEGTHADLLAAGGLYAKLFETQFSGKPAPDLSPTGDAPTQSPIAAPAAAHA